MNRCRPRLRFDHLVVLDDYSHLAIPISHHASVVDICTSTNHNSAVSRWSAWRQSRAGDCVAYLSSKIANLLWMYSSSETKASFSASSLPNHGSLAVLLPLCKVFRAIEAGISRSSGGHAASQDLMIDIAAAVLGGRSMCCMSSSPLLFFPLAALMSIISPYFIGLKRKVRLFFSSSSGGASPILIRATAARTCGQRTPLCRSIWSKIAGSNLTDTSECQLFVALA